MQASIAGHEHVDTSDPPDREPRQVGRGTPVTMSGPVGELVLELYGRRGVAEVAYAGAPEAIATVQRASFGI